MKISHSARITFLGAFVSLFLVAGCSSTYYAAWEKLGVEKRDILKKRVVAARDEQKAAGEEFKDAMTRLKEITGFEGGKLEKAYNGLKDDYEDCNSRAEAVRKRIKDMETVASDLFAEWEKEIKEISTPTLQSSSREQLRATRERYQSLHTALKNAEKSMAPVLTQFKDYVLYLKHNLNAQAIASLKRRSDEHPGRNLEAHRADEPIHCQGGRVREDVAVRHTAALGSKGEARIHRGFL